MRRMAKKLLVAGLALVAGLTGSAQAGVPWALLVVEGNEYQLPEFQEDSNGLWSTDLRVQLHGFRGRPARSR